MERIVRAAAVKYWN